MDVCFLVLTTRIELETTSEMAWLGIKVRVRIRVRVRVRSGSGLGKTVREDPAQDRMAVRTDEQRPMKALRTMVITTLSLEGAGILASR